MKNFSTLIVALFLVNGAVGQWSLVSTISKGGRIYFTDYYTGIMVGDSGMILRTSDGGGNWAVIQSGTSSSLNSVSFPNADTGYIVGGSSGFYTQPGIILKTIDAGINWTILPPLGIDALFSVFFTDAVTGYAVGHDGVFIKTNDGGTNWTVTYPTSGDLHSVYFLNASTGYAVGYKYNPEQKGIFLKTSDGGNT
jgi:photosystem II stability/assembly factor-like uncharacterized protein